LVRDFNKVGFGMGYIIAVDQGTTSTRSIVFDDQFAIVGQGQEEFEQHFPNSGWVEHNPKDLLATVIATCKKKSKGDISLRHYQSTRNHIVMG
jgi:glycerol kinase